MTTAAGMAMTTGTEQTTGDLPGDRAARIGSGPGLTTLGGVVLSGGLTAIGAAGDLLLGDSLGLAFTATFLLGCTLSALLVRVRALFAAVVAPPLLFAASYAVAAVAGDQVEGVRRLALDVATALALSAPVLFAGTAVAAVIAVVRLLTLLARRS